MQHLAWFSLISPAKKPYNGAEHHIPAPSQLWTFSSGI